MRAFNHFIADLNEGATHAQLTGFLHELMQAVKLHGRSGSLAFKLKVAPTSQGQHDVDKVNITVDCKLELPKPALRTDFFWLTDDAEPIRHHPRQHHLDLRDAQDTRGGLRTPAAALAATFSNPDADGVITPTTPLKEVSQ
jgi:hypothetical protein